MTLGGTVDLSVQSSPSGREPTVGRTEALTAVLPFRSTRDMRDPPRLRPIWLVTLTVLAGCALACSGPWPARQAGSGNTSTPTACRAGRAVGLVFVGAQVQQAARELRSVIFAKGVAADVLEKPGKLLVLYRGPADDHRELVQRARALGLEFTIEGFVDVDAVCGLHWQLAPDTEPP